MREDYLEIKPEDIEINFYVDGEEYIVLKNHDENSEEVYIAKILEIDENCDTIVSLTDEEYEKALEEYLSILEDAMEDEDEN